jgi:hypothetical protein
LTKEGTSTMPNTGVHIPPADQLDRLPSAVRDAAAETATLREKHRAARQELVELEHARDAAKSADTEAGAAALRAGKKAPAARLPKAEAAIKAAEPNVDALALAAEQAEADLQAAIGDCAEETRESLAAEVRDQRAGARALAEQIVAAMVEIEVTLGLAAWLQDPTRPPRRFRLGELTTRTANGEPLTVQTAAAELEAALAPPPEPKPGPKVQPLTQVTR